jgi:hypothetical protein
MSDDLIVCVGAPEKPPQKGVSVQILDKLSRVFYPEAAPDFCPPTSGVWALEKGVSVQILDNFSPVFHPKAAPDFCPPTSGGWTMGLCAEFGIVRCASRITSFVMQHLHRMEGRITPSSAAGQSVFGARDLRVRSTPQAPTAPRGSSASQTQCTLVLARGWVGKLLLSESHLLRTRRSARQGSLLPAVQHWLFCPRRRRGSDSPFHHPADLNSGALE